MIRLAILGTGAMAEYQRTKFAALGVEAACFETFPDHAVDAVSCCLVDSLHYSACLEAMERNLPIFCEKPLANTVERARELVRLAPGIAMANLSKRNAPALYALKRDLDAGVLGRVERIDAQYRQGWVVTKVWGDWATTQRWRWRLQGELCTGGVIGDLGVHLMDALIVLFGKPQEVRPLRLVDLPTAMDAGLVPRAPLEGFVSGQGAAPAYVDLEAALTFGAVPCRFAVSWTDASALDSFRIRITGSRADALLDLERSRTAYALIGGHGETLVEGPAVEPTYQRFLAAVLSGQNGEPTFGDALAAQEAFENLLPVHG